MQGPTPGHVRSTLRSPLPYPSLLGLSGSGKSTLVKQMHIIYQDGFSHNAKMQYRESIYSNLLESAQAVAAALQEFNVEPTDPSNVVNSSGPNNLTLFLNPVPRSKCWNGY